MYNYNYIYNRIFIKMGRPKLDLSPEERVLHQKEINKRKCKKYYDKNKEIINQKTKTYYDKNKDSINKKNLRRYYERLGRLEDYNKKYGN